LPAFELPTTIDSNNFFRFEPIGLGAPVLAAMFLIQAVGEFRIFSSVA